MFEFLWLEDFNFPDFSRQFRLKLALLNETPMCWNVNISRKGRNLGMNFTCTGWDKNFYPKRKHRISLSGIQEKVFHDFHQCWQIFSFISKSEFPWTQRGLGNIVLREWCKTTLVHDFRTSIVTFWRHCACFAVILTSFSAKRFNVNILDRNGTKHFWIEKCSYFCINLIK